MIPVIPETAPFTSEQRAWLNGFLAGVLGMDTSSAQAATSEVGPGSVAPTGSSPDAPAPADEEDFPWHDPALAIDERMRLAAGKPLERRLMAAMAQLDCGACGSECKTYSEAIASGQETSLTLCAPGGAETAAKLKEIVAANPSKGTASSPAEAAAVEPVSPPANGARSAPPEARPGSSRQSPFAARLIESTPLTGRDSTKETRFVSFDLDRSGMSYEVGDALGVFPANCPDQVSSVLSCLGATGQEEVPDRDGRPMGLERALLRDYSITTPTVELLSLLERSARERSDRDRLKKILGNGIQDFLSGREALDLLEAFPSARPSIEDFVDSLPKLQPRLYSISSSLKAHPSEVHLTVAVVRYSTHSRVRKGVGSTYLAERVSRDDRVNVFVHRSPRFRLPASGDVPIIMVGPGTGIAPFRAFLQERREFGARGRNWLFFGDRSREQDFLYRYELEAFHSEGLLTRLDTAFSRDQKEKVYVQHRMAERGAEIWSWLEDGAHFYVCGDARRMARDVDAGLGEILIRHGELSESTAGEYLSRLRSAGRYQRDVY